MSEIRRARVTIQDTKETWLHTQPWGNWNIRIDELHRAHTLVWHRNDKLARLHSVFQPSIAYILFA